MFNFMNGCHLGYFPHNNNITRETNPIIHFLYRHVAYRTITKIYYLLSLRSIVCDFCLWASLIFEATVSFSLPYRFQFYTQSTCTVACVVYDSITHTKKHSVWYIECGLVWLLAQMHHKTNIFTKLHCTIH